MAKFLVEIASNGDESFSEYVRIGNPEQLYRLDRDEAISIGWLLFLDRMSRSPKLKARVSTLATPPSVDNGVKTLYIHSCTQLI